MIETFFLDWPFCFAAGLLFGMAGRAEIERAPSPFGTRAFRMGIAYLNLGIVSIAVALFVVRPDWMWMYWAHDLPLVVVALAFALYEVCFVAGFALGPALGRHRPAAIATVAAAAIGFTVAEWAARARLLHLGTIDAFARGAPAEISFSPFRMSALGWFVLVAVPISAASLIALTSRVVTRDRR